jgi:hypothetical protein
LHFDGWIICVWPSFADRRHNWTCD